MQTTAPGLTERSPSLSVGMLSTDPAASRPMSSVRAMNWSSDEVRALIGGREILVAVDGGITKANLEHVASLGVDILVTGSAVYDGTEPRQRRTRDARACQPRPDGDIGMNS